jgi:hypothetical protein
MLADSGYQAAPVQAHRRLAFRECGTSRTFARMWTPPGSPSCQFVAAQEGRLPRTSGLAEVLR